MAEVDADLSGAIDFIQKSGRESKVKASDIKKNLTSRVRGERRPGEKVTRKIFDYFEPRAETWKKINDVLLLHNKVSLIIFIIALNALIFGAAFLDLPFISIIFFYLAISQIWKYIWPILSKIVLREPKEIPEDSSYQRYSVSNVSAFLGTFVVLAFQLQVTIKTGIERKDIFVLGLTSFVLFFIFYCALSFNDRLIFWVFSHAVLFSGVAIRTWFSKAFQDTTQEIYQKGISHIKSYGSSIYDFSLKSDSRSGRGSRVGSKVGFPRLIDPKEDLNPSKEEFLAKIEETQEQ